ncbi:MAG: sulfatase activating formylglycine-generating enzyme [Alphaproteobacteria bacterium]|jgi:formylglycine-generating enzyme required for sulfatase activity
MPQAIDSKIKQAQRKGAGIYVLSGLLTVAVLAAFGLWLFFIKGFSLLIGPSEALNNAKVELVSGLAWVGESKVYTLGGEVSISVSSHTFEPSLVIINNQSPSLIEILLLPSPAVITGQVLLGESTAVEDKYLAQTQWFLNSSLIQVGGELSYTTPPGNYQLEITNPYFQSTTVKLALARAEEVALSPTLASVNGTITIDSVPQGIDVSVDGQSLGKTPLLFPAQGGEYAVRLTSSDFITIDEKIALQTRFLAPKRNYQLLPKPGVLNINATPSDGLLLINNVEYRLGQIDLAANKQHKIQYNKPGHVPYTKSIKVSKDAPTNIDVRLKPLYGQVTIATNVPAKLSVNGNSVESSPVTKRLLSVLQTVEAQANGYRSVKQSFTPQANRSVNINMTLLTEFEARRAEGKPAFVDTLGINMRKFRGDQFTLGSPGNETGRRRNEHQVDIDFSRPFWVSEKEVTQTQFSAFLSANKAVKSNLPVTGVSWLEAAQYANWLSQQEGLPAFYRFQNGRYAGANASSNGYRLPTEAEWEWLAKKAKRAVSTVYVWGNQEKLRDHLGNFADKTMNGKQLIFFDEYIDGKTGVAEVGSYKADRVGLYDLNGNVSEWVHDYYTNVIPDTSKRHVDYLGALRGETWVIKGGNYETGRLRELRSAFREFSASGKATVGFRIARYDSVL